MVLWFHKFFFKLSTLCIQFCSIIYHLIYYYSSITIRIIEEANIFLIYCILRYSCRNLYHISFSIKILLENKPYLKYWNLNKPIGLLLFLGISVYWILSMNKYSLSYLSDWSYMCMQIPLERAPIFIWGLNALTLFKTGFLWGQCRPILTRVL